MRADVTFLRSYFFKEKVGKNLFIEGAVFVAVEIVLSLLDFVQIVL